MDLEKKQILEVTIKSIINTIKDLGFSEEEFLGKSRKMPLPDLRAIAVHYAQNNIFRKTEIIKEDACVIFNRHRTSMFNHAYKKCSNLLEVDEDFKRLYYRFASLFDRHISDENIFIGEDCDYSLSNIQNQYAKKYLYNDWNDLMTRNIFYADRIQMHINNLCIEVQEKQREVLDDKYRSRSSSKGQKINPTAIGVFKDKSLIIK